MEESVLQVFTIEMAETDRSGAVMEVPKPPTTRANPGPTMIETRLVASSKGDPPAAYARAATAARRGFSRWRPAASGFRANV
jgi:hypothetical protein